MSLASASTLVIVDAACGADPGVTPGIRQRIIEILRTGVAASGAAIHLSESEAAAVTGLSKTQLNRWRRGLKPDLGPFPFRVVPDISGRRWRYDRQEVTDFVQKRLMELTRKGGA